MDEAEDEDGSGAAGRQKVAAEMFSFQIKVI